MAECNFLECSDNATTIVAEVYTTGSGLFHDIAGGVFCDAHCPPCVTNREQVGFLWNCNRPHLTKPIADKDLGMVTVHGRPGAN